MNLAIIQARNGSTRLPNKVSMDLAGKTVLEHVVARVKRAKTVDEVVVVTTIEKQDLSLVALCSKLGIRVFIGSEDDVLDRFYQCSKLLFPDNIIRITADCPLLDSDVLDSVVNKFLKDKADYTSNCVPPTFPDGLDVETFSFKALEFAWKNSTLKSDREHVTQYIRNSGKFRISNYENNIDLSSNRWTLDEKEDYNLISYIYKELYKDGHYFGLNDTLEFLEKNAELTKINSEFIRNEGLIKSLNKE